MGTRSVSTTQEHRDQILSILHGYVGHVYVTLNTHYPYFFRANSRGELGT